MTTDNPTTTPTARPDEIEAHAELLLLGRTALDNHDDADGGLAHIAFRDAIAEWSDDTLLRLLMRVKL